MPEKPPPPQPEQKVTALEKAQLKATHEAEYEKERDTMHKKYLEVSELTKSSDKLSAALGISQDDIKKFAERSPDFKDKMQAFNQKAYESFASFRDYYKDHIGDIKVIKTKTDVAIFTKSIRENIGRVRAETHEKFSSIRSSMSDSVKELIEQEKTRAGMIKEYEGVADKAVAHLPEEARAAAKGEVMLDLQYQDTLATLKSAPFKDLSKVSLNIDQTVKRLKAQVDTGEQLDPMVKEFAQVRLQRDQLKAQIKTIDPKTDFVLDSGFPKKYTPALNDGGAVTWTLDMDITDSHGISNSPNILAKETQNMKNQIDALNIMLNSHKADQLLGEIYMQEEELKQITDAADHRDTPASQLAKNLIGYPKSIENAGRDEKQKYFSATQSAQILKDGKVFLQKLKDKITDIKQEKKEEAKLAKETAEQSDKAYKLLAKIDKQETTLAEWMRGDTDVNRSARRETSDRGLVAHIIKYPKSIINASEFKQGTDTIPSTDSLQILLDGTWLLTTINKEIAKYQKKEETPDREDPDSDEPDEPSGSPSDEV